MLIFRLLDLEQMLIIQKSAIYHSIKLPFDAEVAEKILNVIYLFMNAPLELEKERVANSQPKD